MHGQLHIKKNRLYVDWFSDFSNHGDGPEGGGYTVVESTWNVMAHGDAGRGSEG